MNNEYTDIVALKTAINKDLFYVVICGGDPHKKMRNRVILRGDNEAVMKLIYEYNNESFDMEFHGGIDKDTLVIDWERGFADWNLKSGITCSFVFRKVLID